MSKEKLFALYLAKNPGFDSETITFTRSGLRKFFNTTYDEGYKQGFNQDPASDQDEEEENYSPSYRSDSATVDDLLNLFGMRR